VIAVALFVSRGDRSDDNIEELVNGGKLFNASAASSKWVVVNFCSDPYSGVSSTNNGRQRKARRETTT
jgi:hypothetical protein